MGRLQETALRRKVAEHSPLVGRFLPCRTCATELSQEATNHYIEVRQQRQDLKRGSPHSPFASRLPHALEVEQHLVAVNLNSFDIT